MKTKDILKTGFELLSKGFDQSDFAKDLEEVMQNYGFYIEKTQRALRQMDLLKWERDKEYARLWLILKEDGSDELGRRLSNDAVDFNVKDDEGYQEAQEEYLEAKHKYEALQAITDGLAKKLEIIRTAMATQRVEMQKYLTNND